MGEIKEPVMMNGENENENKKEWFSVFDKFGVEKRKSEEAFDKISKDYGSENRFFHNIEHVENLLKFFEQRKETINDYDSMRLAAWFHDVVYDAKATDNEKQSAAYARKILGELGIPEDVIVKVEELILATFKHENANNDDDCSIFLDGDLSILGGDDAVYDAYAKSIWQEYSQIASREYYKQRRKQVLENFLKRERIYFTNKMFEKFEDKARKNIEREIKSLE